MLQELSNLVVADNTGAKRAMCFRILKQRKEYAHLGDVIRVAIKEASPTSSVKKGSVATAVILPGKVLFEVGGVSEEIAKECLRLAATKIGIHTKFITRAGVKI